MSKALELIANYKVGDRLRADDVQALIDHAKAEIALDGFHDKDLLAEKRKYKSKSVMHCINDTGGDLLPYSVFSIADKRSGTGGTETNIDIPRGLAKIAGVNDNASPLLFLTNGSIEIPEDSEFEPEMISFDKPTRVRVSTANPPDVGEQCGIAFETKTITSFRYGLVCLTPSWLESGDRYAWVCRSREPIKVVGCVTTKITKSHLVDGMREAGQGFIQVLYRDANNTLREVNKPSESTEKWSLRIYNVTEIEYAVGMIVSATDTLGMGLTVNHEVPNSLCQMSSGSSASP